MTLFDRMFGRAARKVEITLGGDRAEALTAEAFLAAPNNPLFEAIITVLDNQVMDLGNELLEPKATTTEIDLARGGQKALVDLKATLLDKIDAALRAKPANSQEQDSQ